MALRPINRQERKTSVEVFRSIFLFFPNPKSVCDTRVLDTLYQESLAEGIQNDKRENDQQAARVSNCRIVQRLSCIFQLERRGNVYDLDQQVDVGGVEEQSRVEIVGPLPAECKQEYCDHHGNRYGQNDLQEGAERSRTVHVCRFLQFVGDSAEELTQQENVKSVLKRKSAQRKQYHREIGVTKVDTRLGDLHLYLVSGRSTVGLVVAPLDLLGQNVQFAKELCHALTKLGDVMSEHLDSAALEELDDAENVEITEFHKHGKLQGLVRYDHGQHYQHKQQVSAAELELCKAVTDQTADKRLNDGTAERKRKGVDKRFPISKLVDDRTVNIKRKVFGDQTNRYVHEVLRRHKGAGNLRQEREQYNVGNTYHQHDAEDCQNDLCKEVEVQKFGFQSFFQR